MKRIAYLWLMLVCISSEAVLAEDCRLYFRSVYDFNGPTSADPHAPINPSPYHVQGIRLYHDGNTSFAMSENYNPDSQFFNADERNTGFIIQSHEGDNVWINQRYAVSGKFNDVFPSSNTAELTTLTISNDGRAKIIKDEQTFDLEELSCRGIDKHYFVVDGKVHVSPYTSTWMFTVKRGSGV